MVSAAGQDQAFWQAGQILVVEPPARMETMGVPQAGQGLFS